MFYVLATIDHKFSYNAVNVNRALGPSQQEKCLPKIISWRIIILVQELEGLVLLSQLHQRTATMVRSAGFVWKVWETIGGGFLLRRKNPSLDFVTVGVLRRLSRHS
jgi:hypothetical protein